MTFVPEKHVSEREALLWGNLKHFSFPKLLVYLESAKKTGLLTVTYHRVIKRVYLREGVPTAARSNLRSELMGEFLISQGVINRSQMDEALQLQRWTKDSFGAVLLHQRMLIPKDLFTFARRQFLTILFSLFGLQEGGFRFDERPLLQNLYCYRVSFRNMMTFGIRRISDADYLRRMIGDENQVPVPTENFKEHEKLIFTEDEGAALHAIDGKRSMREIIETSDVEVSSVLKTVLILLCQGMIFFRDGMQEGTEEVVELEASDDTFPGSQHYIPRDPNEEKAVAGNDFLVSPEGIYASDRGDGQRGDQEEGVDKHTSPSPEEESLLLESSDAASEETCLPFGTLLEGESASLAGPVARAYQVCSQDPETSEKVETILQPEIPGGRSLQDTPATQDRERIPRKNWKEEENWERAKAQAAFKEEEVVRALPEGSGTSTAEHLSPHADEVRRPGKTPVCDSSEFSGDPEERNTAPGQKERGEKEASVPVSSAQRRRRGRWFYLSFLILAVGGGIFSITPWRTVLLDHIFVSLSHGMPASLTASPAAGPARNMPMQEGEPLPSVNRTGNKNRQEGGVMSSPDETPTEEAVIPSKVPAPPPPRAQVNGTDRKKTIRAVSDPAQPDKSSSFPPGKDQRVQ